MSKYGPCANLYHTCGPQAAALIVLKDDEEFRLCKPCLDTWLDCADDMPCLEPAAWYWLSSPPSPSVEQLAAALRDPRNRDAVAEALRREARIDPAWLRQFIERENRAHRLALA